MCLVFLPSKYTVKSEDEEEDDDDFLEEFGAAKPKPYIRSGKSLSDGTSVYTASTVSSMSNSVMQSSTGIIFRNSH